MNTRTRIAGTLATALFVCAALSIGAKAQSSEPSTEPPTPPVSTPTDLPSAAEPPATEPPPTETDTVPQLQTGLRVGESPQAQDPLPPTSVDEELDEIRPGLTLKKKFDELAAKTNLRIGFAQTFLFQQASGGAGDRNAGGGDIDLLAKWTAIGAGTKDTGIIAFAGEYRFQIGDQPPSALGPEIGTLLPTTNGFGERPPVVKELYWDHRLFEDHFRYVIGRVDPENLFGGHRLQSANFYFLDKAFSSNPTVAFPGSGMTAAAQLKPTPWMYIDGGINNANGTTTTMGIESFFDDHEFLSFIEAALTPKIEGLGAGRYRVAFWHIDARENAAKPSDRGITVSCDQDVGDTLTVFARYGNSDGDVTGITNSVQGGAGIKHVLGKDSLFGLAAAWSQPKDDTLRDEKVMEVFQRFQITETMQFTLDAELIIDPSKAPGDDVLGVFSARLRISF